MKVESRMEPTVGTWEGLSRFITQGVTLFATGLSGFLLLLIGVPVLMVILMSLRTGFPGESVPFTLENFSTVYLTPRTYEVLLNTIFFAVSSVVITLFNCRPAGLDPHADGHSLQENHLRFVDDRHLDPGFSAHHRMDLVAQSQDRPGQQVAAKRFCSERSAV
jgi:hypothetical protein